MFKEIYLLKKDKDKIKRIQKASIDQSSKYGFIIDNHLVFGTNEWFKSIEEGDIKKYIVKGVISKVFWSGHNDYPEFEIENKNGNSKWTRDGIEKAYVVGNNVELVYVEQKFKNGLISKCVLQINIETAE
jgi:hypothetical protein